MVTAPGSAAPHRPAAARFRGNSRLPYFPKAPARVKTYRPNIKLVLILRNPAGSAWDMFHTGCDEEFVPSRDERNFEEAIREEPERLARDRNAPGTDYVRRGLYKASGDTCAIFRATRSWHSKLGELRSRQSETLNRVCDFLGVPRFELGQELPPVHTGRYGSPMSQSVRETLAKVYAPSNKALFEFLGKSYDWDV